MGLTVVLAGATWAIAGGIAQPGGTAATGAGGGGAGIAAGAWAGAGPMAGTVAPHEAQNLCPGTVIAVPQLGQKPNPVAIVISLRLAGGLVVKVCLGSYRSSAPCQNPVHLDQAILAGGRSGAIRGIADGSESVPTGQAEQATGQDVRDVSPQLGGYSG